MHKKLRGIDELSMRSDIKYGFVAFVCINPDSNRSIHCGTEEDHSNKEICIRSGKIQTV